jgi:hypothetical protein
MSNTGETSAAEVLLLMLVPNTGETKVAEVLLLLLLVLMSKFNVMFKKSTFTVKARNRQNVPSTLKCQLKSIIA